MWSTSSISDCSSETSESSNELRELLPFEKAKSGVWEYFGFPADEFTERDRRKRNEVFCKLCPKKMNYQGNTTNMMVHLQYNHRSEYLKAKEKTKIKKCNRHEQRPQAVAIDNLPLLKRFTKWNRCHKVLSDGNDLIIQSASASQRICYQ